MWKDSEDLAEIILLQADVAQSHALQSEDRG